ncbi:hypothetical protein ACFO5X_24970 [Seohaeicola nanhaiensis]|uniref:Uncharacterized protein n=1 Tax=Seohaeicola nanhaiensis TaxID=1387282 RepID=A0ABV9KQ72_9RHOB
MPDALSRIETLSKTYDYFNGAKDILDNVTLVRGFARNAPKDIEGARKLLGIAENKYKPLKKFFNGTQKEVLAAITEGFPPIPDPSGEVKSRMEKIARAKGPNTPGFEKELDLYLKQLKAYEYELRERLTYMDLVKKKCALNEKNFQTMSTVIQTTLAALKALFVSTPSFRAATGGEILQIMEAGIEKQPAAISSAYRRLKTAAEKHETEIARQHLRAKSALKVAADKKLAFLMEDAKAFFKKLF